MSSIRTMVLRFACVLLVVGCAEKKVEEPVAPKGAQTSDVGEPEARPPAKAGNYGILPSKPAPGSAEDDPGLNRAISFALPLDRIKEMIEKAPAVDEPDASGRTPLITLAEVACDSDRPCHSDADRLAIAKLLVEKGADVNRKTPRFLTPLQGAIDAQHWGLVEYLKSKGAKVAPEILDGGTLEEYIERSKKRGAELEEAPDWLKTDRKPPTKRH